MTHLKKRVTFAGVDYILVPVELWEACKTVLYDETQDIGTALCDVKDLYTNMTAYEGTDEVEDSNV